MPRKTVDDPVNEAKVREKLLAKQNKLMEAYLKKQMKKNKITKQANKAEGGKIQKEVKNNDDDDGIPDVQLKERVDPVFGTKEIMTVFEEKEVKHHVPFLKNHVSIGIFGESGCGKSRLLMKIIHWIRWESLSDVIILSMFQNVKYYSAIKAFCKANKITFKYLSDPDEVMDYIEDRVNNKPEDKNVLIINDDWTQYSTDNNNIYNRIWTHINSQLRNLGGWFVYLTQDPLNMKSKSFANMRTGIIFQVGDQFGLQLFEKNYKNNVHRPDFKRVYRSITNNPHSWMMYSEGKVYRYLHNDGKNSKFEEIPFRPIRQE